jgi:hypothetical protein
MDNAGLGWLKRKTAHLGYYDEVPTSRDAQAFDTTTGNTAVELTPIVRLTKGTRALNWEWF